MEKTSRLIILIVLIVLSFFSCRKEKKPLTIRNITLLHYFSGSLGGGVDEMVTTFNRKHPSLQVVATAIDHESFKTRIGLALSKPNPPELFSYWAGARTESLTSLLSPIDDIWKSAALDDVFDPALVASASEYGASKYLLPLTQHLVGFFYNKSLLEGLGLPEPETWEDFLKLCAKAKAQGILPIALGAKARWPAQFWYDYILLRTAGPDFREGQVGNREPYLSPSVVKAFTIWKELIDLGYFSPTATEEDWDSGAALDVRKGKALMTLMGTWLIGYYKSPEVGWKEEETGFFPFPAIDPLVPTCALGPVDGVILAKEAMDPYGAKEVIRFLADIETQEAFSAGSGALSPSRKVPDSFYSPLQSEARKAAAEAKSWAFNYDLAAPPATAEIGLDLFVAFLKEPEKLKELLTRADALNAVNIR